jgi:uncharacterized membrane protein YkoI
MPRPLFLAMLLGTLSFASPAEARRERGTPDQLVPSAQAQEREQRRISLEQAIGAVQRATGGRVLDAKDLGDQYRIKVLTREGEVRTVRVDARSGEMR